MIRRMDNRLAFLQKYGNIIPVSIMDKDSFFLKLLHPRLIYIPGFLFIGSQNLK